MTALPPSNSFAYVNFKVGQYDVTAIPPNHLESFTYERVTEDASNKLTVVVHDETALILEEQIAESSQDCSFNYGWYKGSQSPSYSAMISNYDCEFTNVGATLTIEAVSNGLTKFGVPVVAVYRNMLISEIVRQIAKEEGWIEGTILETQPVYGDSIDPTTKQSLMKDFVRGNLTATKFIVQELCPYAVSALTGQGGYHLSFSDGAMGTEVNFTPISYKIDTIANFYELEWGTDKPSSVLSFKPDFSGIITALKGGGSVEVDVVDTLKNEMFKQTHDSNTDPYRSVVGDYGIEGTNYRQIVSGSSYTMDEAEKIAATMWYEQADQSYTASMDIVGDPMVQPYTALSFLLLNRDGIPHHSSGIYLITGVTDSIQGGSFVSSLSLVRNALNVGKDSSGGINVTANITYNKDNGSGSADGTGQIDDTNQVIAYAKTFLGMKYVYGGSSPNDGGFDCSGFVQYVYKHFGVSLPRSTYEQVNSGQEISTSDSSQWQAGDLMFYEPGSQGPGHVGLYAGGNQIIEAPHTGDVIKISGVRSPCNVRRVA